MTDPPGEAPPPEAPPLDPKAAEARALLEFHGLLRAVTPRIGVVKAIVALTVGVYAVMVARGVPWMQPTGVDLVAWGANHGVRTLNGQPWRLAANFFLHFGALHLFMNMFALWSAGPVVERIYGSARTVAIYLFAGVTASVASVAVHPRVVSAGASGAVFGIYGALGAFLMLHRGSVPKLALSRLSTVAGSFIVYNVIFGFSVPAIDNAAHLGGLAGGALAGALLARPLIGPRPRQPARVALVLVLAALAVVAAPRVLKAPPDLSETVSSFSAAETRVLDAYRPLLELVRKQEVPPSELADRVDRELLPVWRAARKSLMAPRNWLPQERELLERIDRYAAARERSFEALAAALRSHSPKDFEAFTRADDEVRRAMEEIEKPRPSQTGGAQ